MGFLSILGLAAILTRTGWQIVIAIDIADHATRRADCLARHDGAVGSHIGDQTNSLPAQGDPFIQALRQGHGLGRAKVKFSAGFLLQG